MVLNNALKVLLNHVPYDEQEYDRYDLIELEDNAIRQFLDENNWL
jgi:hypothetical protein